MLGMPTMQEVHETRANYKKALYDLGGEEFEELVASFKPQWDMEQEEDVYKGDIYETLIEQEAEKALDGEETSIPVGYFTIIERYNVFRANEWLLEVEENIA